jgi:GNAT superfamily N-acetyltransferase
VTPLDRPSHDGPPASRHAGGPPCIRRARPHEAALLTEIAHAAKRHWGYPERWMAEWRGALTITPDQVERDDVWLAEVDGVTAGFHCVSVDGERATLEHLWLAPEMIGRGLGAALFRHAAGVSAERGARTLVIDSDPNAEGFYLRMGAVSRGEVRADVAGTARTLPRLELALARVVISTRSRARVARSRPLRVCSAGLPKR